MRFSAIPAPLPFTRFSTCPGPKVTPETIIAEPQPAEEEFYVTTRLNQYALKGLAGDHVTSYGIMTNFREEGYDFYIAAKLREWEREHLEQELGNAEDAARFENIVIPAHSYVVCGTERCKYPARIYASLRRRIVEEWLSHWRRYRERRIRNPAAVPPCFLFEILIFAQFS